MRKERSTEIGLSILAREFENFLAEKYRGIPYFFFEF
jgi:hypothetical protein